MTPEQIEALAREAGFNYGHCLIGDQMSASWGVLEKFAAAARDMALEEACSRLMDMHAIVGGMHNHYHNAANAIRSLKASASR